MGWCQVQHTGHTIPVTELGRHAIFTAMMQVFSDALNIGRLLCLDLSCNATNEFLGRLQMRRIIMEA